MLIVYASVSVVYAKGELSEQIPTLMKQLTFPLYSLFCLGMFFYIFKQNKERYLKKLRIKDYISPMDKDFSRLDENIKYSLIGLVSGIVSGVIGAGGLVGASLLVQAGIHPIVIQTSMPPVLFLSNVAATF